MAYKGGYQLIDMRDTAITVDALTAVKIPGIYEKIESNYRKPIIFTGLKIGSAEMFDSPVNLSVSSGAYHGMIGINADGTALIININDDDEVTISTYEVPEE